MRKHSRYSAGYRAEGNDRSVPNLDTMPRFSSNYTSYAESPLNNLFLKINFSKQDLKFSRL